MVAAGWLAAQGVRRWPAARRQRWALECLDGLQVDPQRRHGEICAHAAAHQETGARARDELAWALDQAGRVLGRHRHLEREPAQAPFAPPTQGVAVGVLAAAGAGMLLLSVL